MSVPVNASIVEHFQTLEDPRIERTKHHLVLCHEGWPLRQKGLPFCLTEAKTAQGTAAGALHRP
jgi:hypothetical protein